MEHTLIVRKADARFKTGDRWIWSQDFSTKELAEAAAQRYLLKGLSYKAEILPTYAERTSVMDGTKVRERFDTPFSCSVASEAYWSA